MLNIHIIASILMVLSFFNSWFLFFIYSPNSHLLCWNSFLEDISDSKLPVPLMCHLQCSLNCKSDYVSPLGKYQERWFPSSLTYSKFTFWKNSADYLLKMWAKTYWHRSSVLWRRNQIILLPAFSIYYLGTIKTLICGFGGSHSHLTTKSYKKLMETVCLLYFYI